MARKLNANQEIFLQKYLTNGFNSTKAYMDTYGVDESVAAPSAYKLLRKAQIAAAIEAHREEIKKEFKIDRDKILRELVALGFSDLGEIMSWGSGGVKLKGSDSILKDHRRLVKSVTETTTKDGGSVRVEMHDKIGPLKLLAQHLGIGESEKGENDPNKAAGGSGSSALDRIVDRILGAGSGGKSGGED